MGAGLKDIERGFVYSDAWVDDARLVVLNAVSAAEKGAEIRTRSRLRRRRAGARPLDSHARRRIDRNRASDRQHGRALGVARARRACRRA